MKNGKELGLGITIEATHQPTEVKEVFLMQTIASPFVVISVKKITRFGSVIDISRK